MQGSMAFVAMLREYAGRFADLQVIRYHKPRSSRRCELSNATCAAKSEGTLLGVSFARTTADLASLGYQHVKLMSRMPSTSLRAHPLQ